MKVTLSLHAEEVVMQDQTDTAKRWRTVKLPDGRTVKVAIVRHSNGTIKPDNKRGESSAEKK
jgi:hypothetical protein